MSVAAPTVSVVVPSYNNAAYIGQTLQSILAQTMADFELVVADHSSTDGTVEIVSSFLDDPRVRLLHTPAGGGARRNWNAVSQAAQAPFLKLVCGDDLLHPRALEVQLAALSAAPDAVMVSAQRRIVDARGEVIFARRGLAGLSGVVPGPSAVRRSVVVGSNIFGEPACVLLRRDALAGVGWWSDKFPYLIDQATYARILGAGDFLALPELVADFRLSAGQWSVSLAADQFQQVRGFHGWARQEYPHDISAVDLHVGNARAGMAAVSRRALYSLLGSRMRPQPHSAGMS